MAKNGLNWKKYFNYPNNQNKKGATIVVPFLLFTDWSAR
jgi:hypothetical protein